MSLFLLKILVGLVVGILIGMSGVGGGVLLLPVLIFGLRVPPLLAVGSDAVFNFFTKVPASIMHLREDTVRPKVVAALALGSVPGSIAGVGLLMHIRHLYGNGVNNFIKMAVGVLLIIVPILMLFQRRIEEHIVHRPPTMKRIAGMVGIGLLAGFLVGMTSVGSGSIIMMLLLLFYSFPPDNNVGTDIVHAVILTGVTGLLHFRLGNVDLRLVACLLLGSIPGGIIGSRLATRLPIVWLRRILCTLLLLTGARMLWA